MTNIQYRDIILAFKEFLKNHRNVQTVIDVQISNFQANEQFYPAVVIVPSTSSTNLGSLSLQFSIFFCDVILADGKNTRDVYSETLEIAKDFISTFTDNPDLDWSLANECSLTPFEERLDDETGGWQLDCTVEVPFSHSVCDIPLNNVAPVDLPPQADFVTYILSNHVTVKNKSINYDRLSWEFSGANVQDTVRDELAKLVYPEPGTYTIKLTAYHAGFPDSICTKTITIQ